jgi:hypothetical protein
MQKIATAPFWERLVSQRDKLTRIVSLETDFGKKAPAGNPLESY